MYAFVRKSALALLATVAVVGVGASPALADEGDVTWTVRTASNKFGEARSSYTYSMNPGAPTKDAMVVANRGKDPLTLTVYAADGFTTDTGQLDLRTKDQKPVGIGAWLKTDRASISLAPGKTTEVPFTVTVPANATPGDYVGGIITSLTQPSDQPGINVERRLGIRVKLRVGGDLAPSLAIENFNLDYNGTFNPFAKGNATVSYTIHNTGNAAMSTQQSVSVAGPFGWFRTSPAELAMPPELLPGESWKVTAPVNGITPAIWLAATADLSPVITDASGSTTTLKKVTATAHGWAIPWTLLAALVLLIAAAIITRIALRRRRTQRKLREDARVEEAVKQALLSHEPA
ncbi:hypothetical protein GCM10010435_46320 [Winogradskya consettensis]|uniref:WxL Interacting Protein peptidoglycan binding domain-containing protein n=1 Tax=Winogradskya consettensis TaxID=113560 RepID=A0A919T1P0_9ACTN|nr:DUF916 domain-containing protein [Actinoplanes consettensis]GIM83053.1 hypothetical protein Aco04nite_84700 [Actinoplanes consettensis]